MAVQSKFTEVLSADHRHNYLRGRSVRGVSLTQTSQGVQFVMQSVSTVVLARLLGVYSVFSIPGIENFRIESQSSSSAFIRTHT